MNNLKQAIRREKNIYKRQKIKLYKKNNIYNIKKIDVWNNRIINFIKKICHNLERHLLPEIYNVCSRKRITLNNITIRDRSVYKYSKKEEANLKDIVNNLEDIVSTLKEKNNSKEDLNKILSKLNYLSKIKEDINSYYNNESKGLSYNIIYTFLESNNKYFIYLPGHIKIQDEKPENHAVYRRDTKIFPCVNEGNSSSWQTILNNNIAIRELVSDYNSKLKLALPRIKSAYLSITGKEYPESLPENIDEDHILKQINYTS